MGKNPTIDPFTGKAPSGAGKYEIKPAIAAKWRRHFPRTEKV